jgi:hypothetical protein
VYRASSVAEIFDAYWDPAHQIEQDRRLEIVERTVLEAVETDAEIVRVSRVVPRRQLPALVRPLISGPLHYVETLRWRRAEDVIEIENLPSFLRGRVRITALYRLSRVGIGLIRRSYSGAVSASVALISTRIERGIVAEYERSLPLAASVTQDWLDRADRSLSARA